MLSHWNNLVSICVNVLRCQRNPESVSANDPHWNPVSYHEAKELGAKQPYSYRGGEMLMALPQHTGSKVHVLVKQWHPFCWTLNTSALTNESMSGI